MRQELYDGAVVGYAAGEEGGCVLFGSYPNYMFLYYPDRYHDKYRVQKGVEPEIVLETNDFGQAVDYIEKELYCGT